MTLYSSRANMLFTFSKLFFIRELARQAVGRSCSSMLRAKCRSVRIVFLPFRPDSRTQLLPSLGPCADSGTSDWHSLPADHVYLPVCVNANVPSLGCEGFCLCVWFGRFPVLCRLVPGALQRSFPWASSICTWGLKPLTLCRRLLRPRPSVSSVAL